MEYKSLLIKYGRIDVKGRNHYKFEDTLVRQLGLVLKPPDGAFHIVKEHDRICANMDGTYDYEGTIATLQQVFGVVSVCPVLRLTERSEDAIAAEAVRFLREITADEAKSFKVFTRCIDENYPGTSEGTNASLGAVLPDACPNLHVDVRNPEVRLNLEIRNEGILLHALSVPGPGDMPVGTARHAILLLPSDIDSPVAGYMIARRGVQLEATYFRAPPYTSECAKRKVVDLTRILAHYAGPVRLHIVSFVDIQLHIYKRCPREELTIIMRRYIVRIAETIAKKNRSMALVTNESIGQIAGQTVPSLLSTSEACTLPVLCPLISFDEQGIIERTEEVESYETSILPFKDCCTILVVKHPATDLELSRIKKPEEKLAERIEELVETALHAEEIVFCEV